MPFSKWCTCEELNPRFLSSRSRVHRPYDFLLSNSRSITFHTFKNPYIFPEALSNNSTHRFQYMLATYYPATAGTHTNTLISYLNSFCYIYHKASYHTLFDICNQKSTHHTFFWHLPFF